MAPAVIESAYSGCFNTHPRHLIEAKPSCTTAQECLLERLLETKPRNLRLSLDSGTLEWLAAPNRRMAAAQDVELHDQYREYSSGHNWVTWKNALPEALEWVLGKGEVGWVFARVQPSFGSLLQGRGDRYFLYRSEMA